MAQVGRHYVAPRMVIRLLSWDWVRVRALPPSAAESPSCPSWATIALMHQVERSSMLKHGVGIVDPAGPRKRPVCKRAVERELVKVWPWGVVLSVCRTVSCIEARPAACMAWKMGLEKRKWEFGKSHASDATCASVVPGEGLAVNVHAGSTELWWRV
jgi:hypothetical protein